MEGTMIGVVCNKPRAAWVTLAAVVLAAGCSGDDGGGGDGSGQPTAPVLGPGGSGGSSSAGVSAGGAGAGTGGTTTSGAAGVTAGAAGASGGGGAGGAAAGGGGVSTGGVGSPGGAGGGAGAAGSSIEKPPPAGSTGCGAADWPESGTFMIDVGGTAREYIVALPDGYDPSTPYKLIFAWHGLGGSAAQVAGGFGGGYYGLQNRAGGSVIFVAGQGLPTMTQVGDGAGWPNTGGQDVAFVRALVDWLRGNYCVDDERIFSVGMSYGGIMSNTLGCQMGDVFRAIAPMSGSGPGGFAAPACMGQVAVWMSHGNTDEVVKFTSGQASRDHWVMSNHCQSTTMPVTPDPCVSYDGCDAGHPVHWCEFDGGHTVPPFASEAIWNFFSTF
jgi:poly(3-hydroxybutyrate) depolymerase